MVAADPMPRCHPDCLAMFETSAARNEALLEANHGGTGGGRDPYSAAGGGLMSIRIFFQNTVCQPNSFIRVPACGHGGILITFLIGCCVIWLCVQELIVCCRRRRSEPGPRVRSPRGGPALL